MPLNPVNVGTAANNGTGDPLRLAFQKVNANDSYLKTYVDNLIRGLKWKQRVDLATTGNITLSGEQSIDGITTVTSRILVKDQTDKTQNGIYTTGSGAWVRTLDADSGEELVNATVSVVSGALNANTNWTSNASQITLGTTDIVWVRFEGADGVDQGTFDAAIQLINDTIDELTARVQALEDNPYELTAQAITDALTFSPLRGVKTSDGEEVPVVGGFAQLPPIESGYDDTALSARVTSTENRITALEGAATPQEPISVVWNTGDPLTFSLPKAPSQVDIDGSLLSKWVEGSTTVADEYSVSGTTVTLNGITPNDGSNIQFHFGSGDTGLLQVTDVESGKNMFNASNVIDGKYIGSTAGQPLRDGEINSASGWGHSGFIPITPGMTYTVSGQRSRGGLCFYTSASDTANIPSTYNTNALPLTITAPSNANFIAFNLYTSSSTTYSNIQLEDGSVVTAYEPYGETLKIKESALPYMQRLGFEVSLYQASGYENYVLTSLNGKPFKQEISPFDSVYPFRILNTLYDGSFFKGGGDEEAPYRIDGGTIGANHSPAIHIKNREIKFFIDNLEVPSNSKYFPEKTFTVKEFYDIEGKNTLGIVAKVSMSYEFNRFGGCTIYTDILGVQNVDLSDIMFIQAGSFGGTYSYYIPKSLPFTQDGISYDFSQPYVMTNFAPINPVYFTPDRVESTGIFADRLIMKKNDLGFAIGYLPLQDAGVARRRVVAVEKALEIRNGTKKVYMSAIDSSGTGTLNAGDYYSVIAYRSYFKPLKNTTASYIIPSNVGTYLYLDWHITTNDRITLPHELSGKPYEIVEKSSGVTVLSKENTGSMVFDVVTKGYVILKFN